LHTNSEMRSKSVYNVFKGGNGVKAYIAGPLFNDTEKASNLKVDALIQSLRIKTYLPQRDRE
jgi:hypothetical protein